MVAPTGPIVVASVGTYSGPVGTVTSPMLQGAQLWVRDVNARGGLHQHPVQIIVYDDGGDPARHRAQVQEAVEQRRVIAFLQQADVIAGRSSLDYIGAKRIPVIGTDTGNQLPYESAMYFPQASSGDVMTYSFIAGAAQRAIPQGKKRLGTLVCAEAATCADGDRIFAEHAKRLGFAQVYRAKASIAQPDYTAECLAAQRAGTQVFIVLLDQNSLGRLGAACARQAYHPEFVIPGPTATDRMKDDPNLEGLLAAVNVFPFFRTGTPETDKFQQALKTYGGKVPREMGPPIGWVSGKLLERAAAALSEPPTSESLLQGLWSIRNDSLGDLTQPLTFVEGKIAEKVSCWYTILVKNGAWVSPDHFQQQCVRLDG